MAPLLHRHQADDLICFGASGARDAAQLRALVMRIVAQIPDVPGGSVVLACRDRYYFIAGLLACLQRACAVMLPPNGQPETVRALLRTGDVIAFLRDDDGEGFDLRSLERAEQRLTSFDPAFVPPQEPDAARLVLYTSGSTGAPQAQPKTVGQLMREAETHVREFGLGGRRVVAGVPSQHIYGLLFSVFVPLTGGGSVLRHTPLFPGELCAELERYRADVLVSVPPQLIALAEDASVKLPSLQRVFCSAGPLPRETNLSLHARGAVITEILGSTETGGIAYREHPDGPYRPLSGVQVNIDRDSILHVDSPWLSPDEPRPFRTADRAEPCPEGFRHLGRADAVTKIAGVRVDLGDVASCLRRVPGVRDAHVLAVDAGGVRGLTLWAVVEADEVSVETLREALRERFDPVTLPKRYRVVAKLPRSDQGKLRRSELLGLFDTWEVAFESRAESGVRVLVPRDLGFLRGHFEGDPILPAVVQLKQIALTEIRRRFPDLGVLERVSDIELGCSVRPGDTLSLHVARREAGTVQFMLRLGEDPSCSGLFHFREAAP